MIDWPKIIKHLSKRDVRYIDIAAECGMSESWVSLLRRGVIREPTYEPGQRLIEMARRYEVPRETYDPQVCGDKCA